MSYILDALRRADAQRERDASRGIHAQPAATGAAGGRTAGSSRIVMLGVVAVIVVAAAAWYFTRSPAQAPVFAPAAPSPSTAAAGLAPAQPVKMLPPQSVANSIVPPAPRMAAPPDPGNTSLPATRGTPQANLAPGTSSDDAARQAREAAFATAVRQASAPIAGPAPPGVQAASPAQVAPATAGLPPDAPKVAISGGVYSPSPAQRMLIVNGQVFNEGSEVAPGVTIDKIESRTAVLKFRGARYTVAY